MDIDTKHLHHYDFLHSLEEESMLDIQKNGIFDYISKLCGSIQMRVKTLSNMVLTGYLVTADTSPRLYSIYKKVLKRLYCDQEYALFVDFGYELTAKSYGSGKDGHLIIINSACLKELNDEELAALLGHEAGHIMAGHIQYRELLDSLDYIIKYIPIANDIVKKKIWSFFSKWMIASEYTADRASLIASGSLEAVISLLRHQAGASGAYITNKQLMDQTVDSLPENLGIFYILMTQSMPEFGMVARMKELVQWSYSEDFHVKAPYLYYLSKLFLDDIPQNKEEEELCLLHQRASHGNVIAQGLLGRAYLYREYLLPFSPETAISLLKTAAYKGDGSSMYYLSLCVKRKVEMEKFAQDVEEQLLRAAGSRLKEAEIKVKFSNLPELRGLPDMIKAFCKKYSNHVDFLINEKDCGQPLSGELAEMVQDSFWMMKDEPVLVADIQAFHGEIYGISLTSKGIYGRIRGENNAYCISWSNFKDKQVAVRKSSGKKFVSCGERNVYEWNGEMKGGIVELLAVIQQRIK